MTDKPTHPSLAAALIAAMSELPAIEPDAVNPHFRSRFVSLGHLIAKTRPVLNRHGLAISQWPSLHETTGAPTLVTLLLHESGERLEFAAPLLLTKSDPQGQGSAITYMRRYAMSAALAVSDQEDDDGNAATTNGATSPAVAEDPVLTGEQVERVMAALAEKATTAKARKTLLAAAGITEGQPITRSQAHTLKAVMEG